MDRNFLPIKTVAYVGGYSSEVPLEEGEVLELREISPGVWLPYEWKLTVWDELAAVEGKRVVSNLTTWKTKEAQLDPQYEIGLFRDIPMPLETLVYEVENGEIVRSSRTSPEMVPTQTPHGRNWLLIGNGVLLALACAVYLMRRLRARPVTPKSL